MKKVLREYFACEICGYEYEKESEALNCEAKPITQDKGVKIGDIVIITGGQPIGRKAKVSRILTFDDYEKAEKG